MLSKNILVIFVGLIVMVVIRVQGKLTCFDQKKDIDGNLIITGATYQYVENTQDLPSVFAGTSLEGSGIWFIQGSGSGKEIKLTLERKLYSSQAKSVQIFIRYYDKSPRSMSLYPVKGPLPLVTLPLSTNGVWTEVRYDVDARTPVEISAFLSAGQGVAFEKIVLAVDSNLPLNVSAACDVITSPLTPGGNPRTSSTSRGTLTTPSQPLSSMVPLTTTGTKLVDANTQCVTIPPTECKCNCLCNCNKC